MEHPNPKNIEELLELPAENLEALSDKDLERHLMRYFPATRPAKQATALAVALDKQPNAPNHLAAMQAKIEQEYEARKAAANAKILRPK
jgi:hypothetical protein